MTQSILDLQFQILQMKKDGLRVTWLNEGDRAEIRQPFQKSIGTPRNPEINVWGLSPEKPNPQGKLIAWREGETYGVARRTPIPTRLITETLEVFSKLREEDPPPREPSKRMERFLREKTQAKEAIQQVVGPTP